jgi:superfamily II DNA or RNA helicase
VLDYPRNNLICKNIKSTFNPNTKGLILVSLLAHGKKLCELLNSPFIFFADAKEIKNILKLVKNMNSFLIIASTKLLSTGFDMKSLNTIHFTSAVLNATEAEQTIGRLERENEFISDINNRYFYIYHYTSFDTILSHFNYKQQVLLNTISKNKYWKVIYKSID